LNIKAFGNSITEGSDADPRWKSYIQKFNNAIGGTLTNLGITGYTSKAALADINQDGELPNTRNYLATWMLGVNDIIFSTTAGAKFANTNAAIEFLCNAFIKTKIAATDGAVTATGSWSTWGSGLANGGMTEGRLTSTAGDEISVSIGSGSKHVFVTLFSNPETDSENWANSVEISYTGQDAFVINPNKRRNNFGHYTFVINTAHYTLGGILKVKNLSGGKMVVDYFGDLKLPQNCYPALVYDTTKVSTYWYSKPGLGHAAGVGDSWFDECNLDVAVNVANTFKVPGYPVAMVNSNKYFNPETMTPSPNDEDGIHPTETGHAGIAKSSMESVILVPTTY
jgi:lysophospholipase L1-like esterase